MQAIWGLTILTVVAADVSHLGYHYKVPQTSYGIPSYQAGGSRYPGYVSSGPAYYKGSQEQYLGSSFSHGESSVPSHFGADAHLSSGSLNGGVVSGSGISSLYNSGSNSGYISGLGNGLSSGLGNGLSSSQYYQTVGGLSTPQPVYAHGSEYQSTHYASDEKHQQFYQVQSNEPAQVFKHFYVHSAPEEPQVPKPRTPIIVPPPQKHYKIIFVKTPNVESHSSQIVPVQPQNEEKTIVYVLVKKPEEHHEVIVPKVEQKPPSKPEVFFVKYNNKEDSQAVINNIVNDYSKDGQSVSYTNGVSEGTPVVTGYQSGGVSSDGLSSIPSYVSGPNYPSGGFSNGFSKFPSSSGSSYGSSFSAPSSVGSSLNVPGSAPISISNGPIVPGSGLFNDFSSSSDANSQSSSSSGSISSFPSGSSSNLSSGSSSSGLSGGLVSGLSSGSNNAYSSGSSLSSLFPAQTGTVEAPVASASASINDSNNVSEGSIFNGASTPSISFSNSEEQLSVATNQGLPHETYGVPKFRLV